MSTAEGFTYKRRKASDAVAIFHHGRLAGSLRGEDATAFLETVGNPPDQELMAAAVKRSGRGSEPSTSLRIARDQEHRGPQGR